jgi:hypothetical protein
MLLICLLNFSIRSSLLERMVGWGVLGGTERTMRVEVVTAWSGGLPAYGACLLFIKNIRNFVLFVIWSSGFPGLLLRTVFPS